ncbi:MAG: elongation factor G [Myxococcales bacterium]|nr:elongation factor G [Myxococcales bacterium]
MPKSSQPAQRTAAHRVAAIVGPHLGGKTTLISALVRAATGRDVDSSRAGPEPTLDAAVHPMTYLGDEWSLIDCPGFIELLQLSYDALKIADIAVLVCEPTSRKVLTLAPYLHFLDEHQIPHVIFINKIDTAIEPVGELLEALRQVSDRPLVLRELPFRENGEVAGFVDLVSERAWHYRSGVRSERVGVPAEVTDQESNAHASLIETLADFDDGLLEKFLEDIMPPPAELYEQLAQDVQQDLVVPVFFGSAHERHGINRLLKSLRHDAPEPAVTAARLGLTVSDKPLARVWCTRFEPFIGKLSYCRVFSGEISQGNPTTLAGEELRIGTVHAPFGKHQRMQRAGLGEVVAISRNETLVTGHLIGGAEDDSAKWVSALVPVFGQVISAVQQKDEVKLGTALHHLTASDSSWVLDYDRDNHQVILRGQGEAHLRKAVQLLANQYHVEVTLTPPQVPYRETIRGATSQHYRFRRQTGGHGQFADVTLKIRPNERGSGLSFSNAIVGGAVPKRFIPAVQKGVVEYMGRGPLGFPLVDLQVELSDGKFHTVDSSDQAFKTAAVLAMRDGVGHCEPVLLEPVHKVVVDVPAEFSSPVRKTMMGHRGQLLGFEQRPGWQGWDRLVAHLPEAEMGSLILELRALTQSVGTYHAEFAHMAELSGKMAESVVTARRG